MLAKAVDVSTRVTAQSKGDYVSHFAMAVSKSDLNVLVRLQRICARLSSNEEVLPELSWLNHCDNVVQSEKRRVMGILKRKFTCANPNSGR